jgi:hypothetical protein
MAQTGHPHARVGERGHGTRWVRGWVHPKVGLEAVEKCLFALIHPARCVGYELLLAA